MFRRRARLGREVCIFLLLTIFIFLIIRMFIMLDRNIRPTVWTVARVKAHAHATQAINNAILEKIAQNTQYQDIISITKDNDGRIALAQINNMKVNTLIAETTLYVQDAIISLNEEKISVPLGQIFGTYILSNFGPRIPITLSPTGIVKTRIIDTFEEAGINQVRHKIFLEVEAQMQIIVPLVTDVATVVTTVLIVDAIYPGEVPDTVINLDLPNVQNPSIPRVIP